MEFSENLKRLMDRANMTQADLSRASGVSTAQIACLVTGRTSDPRTSTVAKLAQALGCTIDELVTGHDPTLDRPARIGSSPSETSQQIDGAMQEKRTYPDHPKSLTERALSESLKELLRERNFDDVTVTDICERAGVSRRSFYRHFLDKYDLMNCTFYQDLCVDIPHHDDWVCWDYMPEICRAFDNDRAYYRHVYEVSGRNSFREYGTMRMFPLLEHDLANCPVSRKSRDTFIVQFYNAVYDDLDEWIRNDPDRSAEEFAQMLRHDAGEFAKVLAETAAREPRSM